MISKKLYIVLIVIIVVFFFVIFLSFGVGNILQENHKATIILGDSTVWKYQNKKWLNVTNTNSLQDLNWKKYEVFQNNQKFGDYYLWKDDTWYLFDKDKNAVNFEGNLLAYDANYDLNVTSFMEDDAINLEYVNSLLADNNIPLDHEFSNASHIAFDFDQDGVVEDFYLVTNAFTMDYEPDSTFSFVFMVKNDVIYMLYESVLNGGSLNSCKPFFNSFLDINQDHVYELILSCGRYSVAEQIDMLYQFQDGAFKIVISNQ